MYKIHTQHIKRVRDNMQEEAAWQNLPPPFIFRLCLLFICVTQKVLPNISHLLFTCKRRNTFIISLGVVTTMKQPLFLLTSIFVVQTLQSPVLLLSICNVEWKRERKGERVRGVRLGGVKCELEKYYQGLSSHIVEIYFKALAICSMLQNKLTLHPYYFLRIPYLLPSSLKIGK